MKIDTELKKILLDSFEAGRKYEKAKGHWESFSDWIDDNESRILALGKPRPLAKNKDSESKCENGGKFPCSPNMKFGILHCAECDKME